MKHIAVTTLKSMAAEPDSGSELKSAKKLREKEGEITLKKTSHKKLKRAGTVDVTVGIKNNFSLAERIQ